MTLLELNAGAINAHEREAAVCRDGMRLAADAVALRLLDPALLYAHRFPPECPGEALEQVKQRPEGFMEALVVILT